MSTYTITEPGVYDGIPNRAYHADPVPAGSLSVSGAKKLLSPSTPAHFKWEKEHPVHKDVFDFGTAAHSLVLEGNADGIEVLNYDSYRTKEAQSAKARAYAEGKTPMLAADYQQVEEMAAAIKTHPIAGKLFTNGKPEQSAFWQDKESGLWRRGRFDWLPTIDESRRLIIPDYKSAVSAAPDEFAKSAARFRYHMQAAWYMDAILEMGLHNDVAFVFVVQEKTAPYAVNVIELSQFDVTTGRALNRAAINVFNKCTSTNEWPDYQGVTQVSLPKWSEYEAEGILQNVA